MEKLPCRPTISLALIAKNEQKNLPRLLDSVYACFDEIILVDTGSTDKTKEVADQYRCRVYDFEWVNDFAKARNFAFSKCSKDYIMWLDCDDELFNREAFIKWRDHAMQFNDFVFATYHYALDKELNPVVSFVRERVFKRSINPTWQYPLHEGIIQKPGWQSTYITTWSVKHMRDAEDIKADRSRNIKIIEEMKSKGKLDARMTFYYGKELFENSRPQEAIGAFEEALKMENLEPHDRILSHQYAGYSAMLCFDQLKDEFREEKLRLFNKALDFATEGIKLDPNRAEFHVLIGDAYVRIGDIPKAVPYFAAAKASLKNFNTPYEGAIYSFRHLYGEAPSLQLAKIYAHLGLLDKAKAEAQSCIDTYNNQEAKHVLEEILKVSNLVSLEGAQAETSDIVFTTPPQVAYEFDEELYKTKAMGGSETALIQMAKLLKEKTGRSVKVFQPRKDKLVSDSGVEYLPATELAHYFSKNKPAAHIAWRHNIKITKAPTYLWCHDLQTAGVEGQMNFDKHLCLTPFHKNYVQALQGVPNEKMVVTRNGIDPSKFNFKRKKKNPNKLVWLSSPDRGLERAIQIAEIVRQDFPDIELHVYYGIENLYKYGHQMAALADRLKAQMSERSWIKYHGFVEQNKMYEEVSDAVAWLHPNNFIETFCITALECLANGIFPVVRRLGALQDTLKEAEKKRQAILLDYSWDDPESLKFHANAVSRVILNRQWENIDFDFEKHSWSSVADEWIQMMGLDSLEHKFAEVAP